MTQYGVASRTLTNVPDIGNGFAEACPFNPDRTALLISSISGTIIIGRELSGNTVLGHTVAVDVVSFLLSRKLHGPMLDGPWYVSGMAVGADVQVTESFGE